MNTRKVAAAKPPVQKVQATTRRASRQTAHDYKDEPSMKLSHAFIVVLVLHVVAVGGIYAFNSIKTQRERSAQRHATAKMQQKLDPAPVPSPQEATDTLQAAPPEPAAPKPANPKPREITEPVAKPQPTSNPVEAKPAKPAQSPQAEPVKDENLPKNSGKTYTVVKGDNPVSIAKKLDVDYDALLKLNRIDDPRKLQIGRKLHIPAKNNGG
jgi:LysM repeat protein